MSKTHKDDVGAFSTRGAQTLGGKNLAVRIASDDKLDVRDFSLRERLSALFQVDLVAVSDNPSIDFDAVVGFPATFVMSTGAHERMWSGVCKEFDQIRVEPGGLSTYQISIVPTLWFLTQRKNHRMFQHISEPNIVLKLLGEWGIHPEVRLDKRAYKKRKYRVQYAETDFAFVSRMLEEAGITFWFEEIKNEMKLVLSDAPQSNEKRARSLLFLDDVSMQHDMQTEFVTAVRVGQRVRPGKYTMRDHDHRKPAHFKLQATAARGSGIEEKLERFHYVPGAFLFGSEAGESTPVADDKGKTRTDEKEAAVLAKKRLDAKRGDARVATFETNAHDLAPGVVTSIRGYAHAALQEGKTFLVVESSLHGTAMGEWTHRCEVRGTDVPYRPALVTPRPKTNGVESATVVGPPGEEIHCDEFGRVRVHFHWDRESRMDSDSSCWIHVSQSWSGAGYGGTALPRVGQEVLVDFLGGDPDRPIIVGRVYTNLQKTPYKLPENKAKTGLRSQSMGGGGGYNELMFDDKPGHELVNLHAERDMKEGVKHDKHATIGHNHTKTVGNNEREVTGNNRSISVGVNRSTQVGHIDSTIVGDTHVVMVSPPGEYLPARRSTSFLLRNKSIVFDTGDGARLELNGSKITLHATTIQMTATDFSHIASNSYNVLSCNTTSIGAVKQCTLSSAKENVLIRGEQKVRVETPGTASFSAKTLYVTATDVTQIGVNSFNVVSCNQTSIGGHKQLTLSSTGGLVDLNGEQGVTMNTDQIIKMTGSQGIWMDTDQFAVMKGIVTMEQDKLAQMIGTNGVTMKTDQLVDISGTQGVTIQTMGPAVFRGMPIKLNDGGLFAARVMDLASGTILAGSATVLIGGGTFPEKVEKYTDPVTKEEILLIGKAKKIVVKGSSDFQITMLAQLGGLSQAHPDMLKKVLESVHKMTIQETTGNSYCDPNDSPVGCDVNLYLNPEQPSKFTDVFSVGKALMNK